MSMTTGIIVPSGSGFKVKCKECSRVLLRDLPSERAAYCNAGAVVAHVCRPNLLRRLANSIRSR